MDEKRPTDALFATTKAERIDAIEHAIALAWDNRWRVADVLRIEPGSDLTAEIDKTIGTLMAMHKAETEG